MWLEFSPFVSVWIRFEFGSECASDSVRIWFVSVRFGAIRFVSVGLGLDSLDSVRIRARIGI